MDRAIGQDGKILCGDRMYSQARRLCGDCSSPAGWPPGTPSPPGCGALLERTADGYCSNGCDRLRGPCCDLCGDCRAAEQALGRTCCTLAGTP
jgi:hypothetical protein